MTRNVDNASRNVLRDSGFGLAAGLAVSPVPLPAFVGSVFVT
jgi:hypothetical protein